MKPEVATGIASDLSNLGFGIWDRLSGGSDTATNDQRWMNDFAWKQSLRNEEFNRHYTQNQMQIRTADANAAGLHPLAALGINVQSGPSVAAFTGAQDFSRNRGYSDMSNLGQNTQRALMAQATAQERAIGEATIRKLDAETNLLNRTNPNQGQMIGQVGSNPPPMPDMHKANKYQLLKRPDGSYEWVLSSEASQAIMSDPIKMWAESLENAFAGPNTRPFWRAVGEAGKMGLNPWRKK